MKPSVRRGYQALPAGPKPTPNSQNLSLPPKKYGILTMVILNVELFKKSPMIKSHSMARTLGLLWDCFLTLLLLYIALILPFRLDAVAATSWVFFVSGVRASLRGTSMPRGLRLKRPVAP